MWMVRGANAEAVGLARRAQAVAGRLGLTDVLSDALNSQACAVRAADGEWAGTLRQALDIALAGRHEAQAARAYGNLHAGHAADRDWAAAGRYFAEGAPTATTMTSPPTRCSCAASGPASWSGRAGGTRP
jgi:hypothetical protein